MMSDHVESEFDVAAEFAGSHLPPGRWEELRPRLAALVADFDELKKLESLELEPMPAFRIEQDDDDGRD
jgi:hypothetical protein